MSEEEITLWEMESDIMSRYYEATGPDELVAILLELVDVRNDLAATVTMKVSEVYPFSDWCSTAILLNSLSLTTQVLPVDVSFMLVILPY